jgi:opacity protein-like surface antigen
MRGKILLSAVALSLSAAAFASGAMPAPEPINYFDGFYIGVAAGVQHLQSSMNGEAHDVAPFVRTTDVTLDGVTARTILNSFYDPADDCYSGDMGRNSVTGDLFIGYGQTFHPDNMGDGLYAGIELYGSIGKADPSYQHAVRWHDITTDTTTTVVGNTTTSTDTVATDIPVGAGSSADQVELENKWAFGALLKGGYLMTPKSMIYIVLGTEYQKFDVEQNHAFVFQNAPIFGVLPLVTQTGNSLVAYSHNDFSQHKWGFIPGIGIETMVSNNWSLRAQYTYAIYGSFSGCDVDAHVAHNTALIGAGADSIITTQDTHLISAEKVSFKPRIGKFELGLTYHANGV